MVNTGKIILQEMSGVCVNEEMEKFRTRRASGHPDGAWSESWASSTATGRDEEDNWQRRAILTLPAASQFMEVKVEQAAAPNPDFID